MRLREQTERERKRREDEYNKREIEWRDGHKKLLKYSTVESIMYRREPISCPSIGRNLFQNFKVVDEDNDGLVNWRDTVDSLIMKSIRTSV